MENFDKFLSELGELISFRSVQSEPENGMPFGKGVYRVYKCFMDKAESYGLQTINYDNYFGEVDYGDGEEIGIIGHLDIVPEGDGWNTDPYTLTEKDGVLYARGILDDKAPLFICLYILKELKEKGIKSNKKIRLFVGCNEETGWKDVAHFTEKHKFPEYGFSPDGNFPVSYAEKGVLVVTFKVPTLKKFKNVKGGSVVNAVCGRATAEATGEINLELIKKHGLNVNGNVIESIGKSCHGSRPDLGVNAFKALFEYFKDEGEDVGNVVDYLFNDKGNVSKMVNEQGDITFSPDLAEEKDGYIYFTCDCRIPAPFTEKDATAIFDTFGIEYTATQKHEPVCVDKDGDFVQTLLKAYNDITGSNEKPLSQCGSTFARVFEKGCAFGPEFPGEKSTIHEANECCTVEQLKTLYGIYYKTITSLIK